MKSQTLPAQSLAISECGDDGARHPPQTQTCTGQHEILPKTVQPDPKQMETVGPSPRHHHSCIYLSQYDLHVLPPHLEKVVENQSFPLAYFIVVSTGPLAWT